MNISELFRQDEYTVTDAEQSISFDRLETEPNNITKSSLFFLISCVSYDEKKNLPFVLSKKPAAVVCEEMPKEKTDVPIVIVPDVREAFAYACYRFHHVDTVTYPIIGITGTNGKTTVATEICRLLENSGKKVGYIGTGKITCGGIPYSEPYYTMTTPDPPLLYSALEAMQYERCDFVVMEVSSHALALHKVAPLHFSCAVFIGLSEEHLDFHKNMEEYYQTKKILFSQTDTAIINVDNPFGERLYSECKTEKISISALAKADVYASCMESFGFEGTRFLWESENQTVPIRIHLPGFFQIQNALLSATVCQHLGVTCEDIRIGFEAMTGIPGRMEKITEEPLVILDYAHTPKALESTLEIIDSNKRIGQKVIVIFGCGGERDRAKRPLMASVAEKYADFVYVTSDNSRSENPLQIFKDIESGFQENNHKSVYARERAIAIAIENASPFDIILVEGKGDEPYIKDKTGFRPYNERRVIRDAVCRKKSGELLFHENTISHTVKTE